VALFLAALITHEAGHALVLRKLGIPIQAAGIGLPIPPVFRLKATVKRPFVITFSPWLLGAYVEPHKDHEDRLNKLSYRDTSWYAGVGIIVNLVTGGIFVVAYDLIEHRWSHAALFAAGTAALWLFRRFVAAYILPVAGIASLWIVISGIILSAHEHQSVGVIGTAQMFGQASSLSSTVSLAAVMCIALGIMNVLPIYPLDGGRIADAAIRELLNEDVAKWFRRVTGAALFFLVIYTYGSDVWTAI
jgi:membrane-associated protease RseP (regulator of RpoE activity)